MALAELIADPDTGVGDVAAFLDAMDPGARWAVLSDLGRGQQRTLYRKADPAGMDLGQLVGGAGRLVEVVHDGVNTLPVPGPLRRFEKRFCRPGDTGVSRLFGYNEGLARWVLGPGYFVAVPAGDRPAWRERGGVVIDYLQVPDGPVALGWPRVVPNSRGLQRFVYRHTRDYLRHVSAHVCVGAVFRRDHPLDHYFVLCRRS